MTKPLIANSKEADVENALRGHLKEVTDLLIKKDPFKQWIDIVDIPDAVQRR